MALIVDLYNVKDSLSSWLNSVLGLPGLNLPIKPEVLS
jgi:hypothetical protein